MELQDFQKIIVEEIQKQTKALTEHFDVQTKETLRLVILINNSLQTFKQETTSRFEAQDKHFEDIHAALKELRELILKGDQTLVKFLVERERETKELLERVDKLETRLQQIELVLANRGQGALA